MLYPDSDLGQDLPRPVAAGGRILTYGIVCCSVALVVVVGVAVVTM